jgi:hypothetical protein
MHPSISSSGYTMPQNPSDGDMWLDHSTGETYCWSSYSGWNKLIPTFTDSQFNQTDISFNVHEDEMLRIASDGFYVRGQKVPMDDKEAQTVYNAFKQWLTWNTLQK